MNTPIAATIRLKAMLHKQALSIIPRTSPVISFVGVSTITWTMNVAPAGVRRTAVRSVPWSRTVVPSLLGAGAWPVSAF